MPRVAVVVPARDAARTLPATLDALARQTRPADTVVVVDNGSADATAQVARRHPVVHAVVPGPGRGPGPARNAGVAVTDAAWIAFTDADCVPAPGWLAALLAAAGDEAPRVVQGRVAPDPDAPRAPWDRTLAVPAFTGLFETANLLVPRATFDAAGGFPDGIEAPGEAPFGEDALLGWALVAAGAEPAFAADALVHHAVVARAPAAFVAERRRLALFPPLVAAAPPVRDTFLRRRLFLTQQTQAFDLAILGLATALLTRRFAPALAVLPYALRLRRLARHWPQHPAATTVTTHVRADIVGCVALLRGSRRARTLVV